MAYLASLAEDLRRSAPYSKMAQNCAKPIGRNIPPLTTANEKNFVISELRSSVYHGRRSVVHAPTRLVTIQLARGTKILGAVVIRNVRQLNKTFLGCCLGLYGVCISSVYRINSIR